MTISQSPGIGINPSDELLRLKGQFDGLRQGGEKDHDLVKNLFLKTEKGQLQLERKEKGLFPWLKRVFAFGSHYKLDENSVTVSKLNQLQKAINSSYEQDDSECEKAVNLMNDLLEHVRDVKVRDCHGDDKKRAMVNKLFSACKLEILPRKPVVTETPPETPPEEQPVKPVKQAARTAGLSHTPPARPPTRKITWSPGQISPSSKMMKAKLISRQRQQPLEKPDKPAKEKVKELNNKLQAELDKMLPRFQKQNQQLRNISQRISTDKDPALIKKMEKLVDTTVTKMEQEFSEIEKRAQSDKSNSLGKSLQGLSQELGEARKIKKEFDQTMFFLDRKELFLLLGVERNLFEPGSQAYFRELLSEPRIKSNFLKGFEAIESGFFGLISTEYGTSGALKRGIYVDVYNELSELLDDMQSESLDESQWPKMVERLGNLLLYADAMTRNDEKKVYQMMLQELVKKTEGVLHHQGKNRSKAAQTMRKMLGIPEDKGYLFSPDEFLSLEKLDEKKQALEEILKRNKLDKSWINSIESDDFKTLSLNKLLSQLEAHRKNIKT